MVQNEGILFCHALGLHEPADTFVHVQVIGQGDALIESSKSAFLRDEHEGRDSVY